MKKTFTNFHMRSFLLLCTWCFLALPLSLSAQSSFILDVSGAKKLPLNIVTSTATAVPLSSIGSVKSVAITGAVTLKNSNGYARVILADVNGREHLVYEANGATVDGLSSTFINTGEETYSLSNVKASLLRIELSDATLSVSDLYYVSASAKSAREDKESDEVIRRKQAEEKAERINAQIKKTGQKWKAGVTPIALLTYEQKKNLFKGQVPNLQGAEYYKGGIFTIPSATSSSVAPKSAAPGASLYIDGFDWRNRHGQFWLTSVKDQGGCGSCWAFAATATTEQLVNLYYNRHLNLDLSEQDALSCSGAGNCTGGWPDMTLDYIKNSGIVNDGCFTYAASDLPCANKCASPSERIKIGGRKDFNSANEDSLKAMIIKGPVSGGIYSWSHALNLVGYKKVAVGDQVDGVGTIQAGDPNIGKTMWIFKNSWGQFWGDNGYLYLVTDINNIGWTHAAYGPVSSIVYNTANIQCTDADGDGYYFWGLGPKPAHCPASPALADGDDSNPTLGPLNAYGYCQVLGTQYTVTTTTPSNGTIQLSPAGGSYAAGTVVTVTATPNTGYKFSSWGGSLSGTTNPTTLTVNANKTVSATFTAIPLVSITSPANYAGFNMPNNNVTIAASASFAGGTISKVEFYSVSGTTSTKIGEDASSPYSYTWTNRPLGSYQVKAKVITNTTATAESDVVNFYVTGPNTPPTVSIVTPINNAHYASPATFEISTNVSDQESPIDRVEFYQNGNLIGIDEFYPGFGIHVGNLTPGTYVYTAKAYDEGGLSTTSSPVTIIVDASNVCTFTEAVPPAAQWLVRNDWYDQSSGSNVTNESSALKVTHRAYGQNFLWVLENVTFPVVSGRVYTIKFDFKDFAGLAINGIEVGFGTSVGQNGPVLAQPTVVVPSGYSSAAFTTKSVNITSTTTGNVRLSFKLKWASQPTVAVVDYIKNLSVCDAPSASYREGEATSSVSMIEGLVLSPNPTDHLLSIQAVLGGHTEVEVRDVTGVLVLAQKLSLPEGNQVLPLDVKSLHSGIYSLLIKSDGKVWKQTFVKQ